MKLVLAERVVRKVEQKEAWWAKNRLTAPDLLAREFRDTLEHIRTTPGSGIGWPAPRRPSLRRILMPRTQNHIFFVLDDETQTIRVLAVWGAVRERSPKL